MYNALNEDYMFQETRERVARLNTRRTKDTPRPNRRWWRKAAHVAR
ncbi:MAG: hypothetical protein JWR85_2125 [Marmoricola sp.]|jgi:hypothetical protein|nr:hypothetical protein [Marmoricola sp.]